MSNLTKANTPTPPTPESEISLRATGIVPSAGDSLHSLVLALMRCPPVGNDWYSQKCQATYPKLFISPFACALGLAIDCSEYFRFPGPDAVTAFGRPYSRSELFKTGMRLKEFKTALVQIVTSNEFRSAEEKEGVPDDLFPGCGVPEDIKNEAREFIRGIAERMLTEEQRQLLARSRELVWPMLDIVAVAAVTQTLHSTYFHCAAEDLLISGDYTRKVCSPRAILTTLGAPFGVTEEMLAKAYPELFPKELPAGSAPESGRAVCGESRRKFDDPRR